MTKSTKAFAYNWSTSRLTGKVTKLLRTPAPPESVRKFKSGTDFPAREASDYLEGMLKGVPYATFNVDNMDVMNQMLEKGFTHERIDGTWVSIFASWREQEGRAWLVPQDSGLKDHRDVGVTIEFDSPDKSLRAAKYMKRLFTSYPGFESGGTGAVWGDEVSYAPSDQSSLILMEPRRDLVDSKGRPLSEDDRTLSVKYVDLNTLTPLQKALVDGMVGFGPRAPKLLNLGKRAAFGSAWRVTASTPRKYGKGHGPLIPWLSYDMVIYGGKDIVKTKRFFFGNMTVLHVGNPKTDRQSFVNYRFDRNDLAFKRASEFMLEVLAASTNEVKLRTLVLTHMAGLVESEIDEQTWILRDALQAGVSFLAFPGLFRRCVKYLCGPGSPVFQCYTKARIPLGPVADYGYILPDLRVIDEDGEIHPERGIQAGHMIFPDDEPGTRVVGYRQPSEHGNAWRELEIEDVEMFRVFAGKGICMLGQGALEDLEVWGGADMDDSLVIVKDPLWVESFRTLPPYPVTEKLSATAVDKSELYEGEEDIYGGISYTPGEMLEYSKQDVYDQEQMERRSRAGIGPVSNFGLIDSVESAPDQKAAMLADLVDDPASSIWLERRTPYQAARFLTNLEVIIDAKDPILMAKLGDISGTINKFHKTCKVYPLSMANRIPQSKRDAKDYVLARSLTCRQLLRIKQMVKRLQAILIEREWKVARPASKALQVSGYPWRRPIHEYLFGAYGQRDEYGNYPKLREGFGLNEIWGKKWAEALSSSRVVRADETEQEDYNRICGEIEAILEPRHLDDHMMEWMACHLYYQAYRYYNPKPKVNPNGSLRNYPDGLLWSPVFNQHFLNALEKAGFSGYYKACELYPQYRKLFRDKELMVKVVDHKVYMKDKEGDFTLEIGNVYGEKSVDGVYAMVAGIIEFRQPHDMCRRTDI